MTILEHHQNLLFRIRNQFDSVEEGHNQPIDPNIGYFSFVVFEPGRYRCYRTFTDRSGNRTVSEDNPIDVYSLTEAARAAEIELGKNAFRELISLQNI